MIISAFGWRQNDAEYDELTLAKLLHLLLRTFRGTDETCYRERVEIILLISRNQYSIIK